MTTGDLATVCLREPEARKPKRTGQYIRAISRKVKRAEPLREESEEPIVATERC